MRCPDCSEDYGIELEFCPFCSGRNPRGPVPVGTEMRYFQNFTEDLAGNPRPLVPVEFDLKGPWDFSEGPTEAEMVWTAIDRKSAPDAVNFPDAPLIGRMDISNLTHFYSFDRKDEDGVKKWGWASYSYLSKVPRIATYNPPSYDLRYPLDVGRSWENEYKIVYSGLGPVEPHGVKETIKYIASNRVVTPFDTYGNCILIQYKTTTVREGEMSSTTCYSWRVPEVGKVVTIISKENEENEVFTEAHLISRLKFTGKE